MKTLTTRAAPAHRRGAIRRFHPLPLLAVLLVAIALRLLLWAHLPRTGLISDEGEYLSAASWLANGRGFTWYLGYFWTRAPLYPLFVAAHLRLFGETLTSVYVTQTLLSLANVALVYLLARYLTTNDHLDSQFSILNSQFSIPTLSALLMAIYLPFALYTQVLLSETLFITLLLGAFLALAIWTIDDRRPIISQSQLSSFVLRPSSFVFREWPLIVAGLLFGLATLTRSLTLFFIPIVALWVLLTAERRPIILTKKLTRRAIVCSVFFVLCSLAVILPWTLYNSARLYGGVVVVDTSGAFNLMLGARTAYDGRRDDAPPRSFALALLDRNLTREQRENLLSDQRAPDGRLLAAGACLYRRADPRLLDALSRPTAQITQAERQRLMTAEGLCLIGAQPLAFVQKSLAELVDLFQINYTGAERFANGFGVGRLPRWYSAALFALDDTIYVLVLPLAVIGWVLIRSELKIENAKLRKDEQQPTQVSSLKSQVSSLIGLWWLYNIALAPLLFAINRFRLPLLPFAFIFAAYALIALFRGGWGRLRSRYGATCATLAVLLALIATTPYAYLEPRAGDTASAWASYLGPHPSSLADTIAAWRTRPGYQAEQRIMRTLGQGDAAEARALLASGDITSHTLTLARPLLAALEGRADAGLKLLPPVRENVELAVVRGDLLRHAGDPGAAKAMFTPTFVDSANPVQWAWDWLHPAPTTRIDLAGNLDLGYIEGCYLGEGTPDGTFRWCTDGARLRFPGAGTGAPQTLALRADGRGWSDGLRPAPPVRVLLGEQDVGTFTPDPDAIREFTVVLPPTPPGADVIVTLRTETFVPSAERYISQQGSQVGQVHRLGVRLDWAELRGTAP